MVCCQGDDRSYVLADPRECTQNGDDNKDVGDDAASDDGRMLHSAVTNNVDDFIHEPARHVSSFSHQVRGNLRSAR